MLAERYLLFWNENSEQYIPWKIFEIYNNRETIIMIDMVWRYMYNLYSLIVVGIHENRTLWGRQLSKVGKQTKEKLFSASFALFFQI